MRKSWEIQRSLYGWYVPYIDTKGDFEVEARMLLNFEDTDKPAEINYIVWPSFGGNHSFKKIDRFMFSEQFNYCEYEQHGSVVCGGYIDFEVFAQCGERFFEVEYCSTRNRAKRLTHKLNRALNEGCRIFTFNHNGQFVAV